MLTLISLLLVSDAFQNIQVTFTDNMVTLPDVLITELNTFISTAQQIANWSHCETLAKPSVLIYVCYFFTDTSFVAICRPQLDIVICNFLVCTK